MHTGGYKAKTGGRSSAYIQGVFIGNKIPSVPRKAPLDNPSNPSSQPSRSSSPWKSANINDTSTSMLAVQGKTLTGHGLGNPSKTAKVVGTSSRRYDIETLKRWQPAKGGTTLAIASRAASQMRSLLPPPEQPLFGRPAVDIEHASHAVKGFLYQAQKADHRDAGVDAEIGEPAIPLSDIPIRTQQPGLAKVTDKEGLVEGHTPQATVRSKDNVDLLGLYDVTSPELDDKDTAKASRPGMQIQTPTPTVWKSNCSRTLAQFQSVIFGDGCVTGGREVGPKNKMESLSGGANTLVKDEAEHGGATKLLSAIGHATTESNNKCPLQEVTANESAAAEGDHYGATRIESDTKPHISSKKKVNSAGAVGEGNVTTTERQTTQSVPYKDIIAQEESKDGVINDPFKWLLPASFR